MRIDIDDDGPGRGVYREAVLKQRLVYESCQYALCVTTCDDRAGCVCGLLALPTRINHILLDFMTASLCKTGPCATVASLGIQYCTARLNSI